MVIGVIARNWETFQFHGRKNNARRVSIAEQQRFRVRLAARKISSTSFVLENRYDAGKCIPLSLRSSEARGR